MIQELLAAMEEAKLPSAQDVEAQPAPRDAVNDELRAKLDALAMDLAHREGQRVESGWRISELEQQVARLEQLQSEATPTLAPPPMPPPMPDAGGSSADPGQSAHILDLQNELDALRQAFAQEHEARVRAESGEDLSKAHAELARQATLVEQLSRELDARDRARRGDNDELPPGGA
jgi:hypothetical protein